MPNKKRYAAIATRSDGTPHDGARVEFQPSPPEVRILGGVAVSPRVVKVEAGTGGAFEVDLVPGTYAVTIQGADGAWDPTFKTLARENTDETDFLKIVEANP